MKWTKQKSKQLERLEIEEALGTISEAQERELNALDSRQRKHTKKDKHNTN